MKDTFASKVRAVLLTLADSGRKAVSKDELCDALDLVSNEDKRPLYAVLRDFHKSGEIESPAPHVYVYEGKQRARIDIQAAIWAVIRMRKSVTVEDLQELTGAKKDYAKEFLQLLVRREVIEKMPAKRNGTSLYRLVNDIGKDTPENDEKAARLRKSRAAKKAALDMIAEAGNDLISAAQKLNAARIAVNDMPEHETMEVV